MRRIVTAVDTGIGIAAADSALLETVQLGFRQSDFFLRCLHCIPVIRSIDAKQRGPLRHTLAFAQVRIDIDQLAGNLSRQRQFLARTYRAGTLDHQVARPYFQHFGFDQRDQFLGRLLLRFGAQ